MEHLLTASVLGVSVSHILALGGALLFSTFVGLEREWSMKDAGLRTHCLVGVASALIMLVSKYGFDDVLGTYIDLDPARLAAQIVSGIGFIGGGLIFVHRDVVRGLTTAASIWLTAAIGMCCGAGLFAIGFLGTVIYFLVAVGYHGFARYVIEPPTELLVEYRPGHEVVTRLARVCASWGFLVQFERDAHAATDGSARVRMRVSGRRDVQSLMVTLEDVPHVQTVTRLPRNTKPMLHHRTG